MKNFTIFLVFSFIFLPSIVFAFSASEIVSYPVPATYIYPQQFDVLVLDITIPSGRSGEPDILKTITVQNEGTAHNITEISKMILWKDTAKLGFQGMGIDEKIGEFNFYAENSSWYLDNLNVIIPAEGLRFFVTVEIAKSPTSNTTFQMKIPALQDQNQNGKFDPGDLGIFLETQNNGPSDNLVLNQYLQTIRTFVVDELPPKSVITDPLDNATLATTTYKISIMARDQGGSTVQWVKIAINPSTGSGQVDDWYDATPSGENYTWKYNWTNIAEGNYLLKIKSVDWLGNIEAPAAGISVSVLTEEAVTPAEEAVPPVVVVTPPTEEIKPPAEKPISQMTREELQAEINKILAKIEKAKAQLEELQRLPSKAVIFKSSQKYGAQSDEVKQLQNVLIREGLLKEGLNTGFFGPLTQTAVIRFQEKYAADILTPLGLTKGTGFVGEKTRAKLNELYND